MAYIQELAAELRDDPENTGYEAHMLSGNDVELLALINGKTIAAYGDVDPRDFKSWAAGTGQRAVIEAAAADNSNLAIQAIALTLKDMFISRDALNVGSAGVITLMGAWVAAGKATQQVADALTALGATHISRSEQLWGRGFAVNGFDLSNALLEV
jgi:hypothetical protein